MKIKYVDHRLHEGTLDVIAQANEILEDYADQGFDLTLRQLYYQFVARDLIENTQKSYKRLGDTIAKGRDAGLIDWDSIVDRARNIRGNPHWDSPADIIDASASQFRYDLWEGQPFRVEVWIEKEALLGVVEPVCTRNDIKYYACKGYNSQSEMWRSAQRARAYYYSSDNQQLVVLHLGDHDPSGLDMSRDLQDRFRKYGAEHADVNRIALNWEQVEEFSPPPNPCKMTDSRSPKYVEEYGEESWELDALSPTTIDNLIQTHIDEYKEHDLYQQKEKEQQEAREVLRAVSNNWEDVVERYGS